LCRLRHGACIHWHESVAVARSMALHVACRRVMLCTSMMTMMMMFRRQNGCSLLARRMQPTVRHVTAASMIGRINYDGRSPTSRAYLGGAAYMGQCWTCGLQPGSAGSCFCCCKSCCQHMNGRGNEAGVCSRCSGVAWVPPQDIATVHVRLKPKRKRSGTDTLIASAAAAVIVIPSSSESSPVPACHGGGAASMSDSVAAPIHVASSSQSQSPPSGDCLGPPPAWMLRYMTVSGAAQVRAPSGSDDDDDPFAGLPD
jgi:hypothetical protein